MRVEAVFIPAVLGASGQYPAGWCVVSLLGQLPAPRLLEHACTR